MCVYIFLSRFCIFQPCVNTRAHCPSLWSRAYLFAYDREASIRQSLRVGENARERIAAVLSPWATASGQKLEELQENVLGFEHPTLSTKAVKELCDRDENPGGREAKLDALHGILTSLWAMTTAAMVHGLWCWRVRLHHGEPTDEHTQRAILLARVTHKIELLRHVVLLPDATGARSAVIEMVLRCRRAFTREDLQEPMIAAAPLAGDYVLFFMVAPGATQGLEALERLLCEWTSRGSMLSWFGTRACRMQSAQ